MKILYLGTVCNIKEYEKKLRRSKSKPTNATIIFETALLQGFKEWKSDVTIYSFPMIPSFEISKLLYWGNITEELDCGYKCTWLRTINLPILKQLTRKLDGKRVIKKWIKQNEKEECIILTYSIPPFLAQSIIRYSQKYNVKCCAIIPDLLQDMYINRKGNKVKNALQDRYLKSALAIQGNFDGYIYLTEAMKEKVNPDKPYIVIEGIADINSIKHIEDVNEKKKAIMYAGGLYEKYGIINLIKAFELIQDKIGNQVELWLFGDGTAVEQIKRYAEKNSSIRYFGRKSREEILKYEKSATLLVNLRSTKESFTKYSFPSKTIEYMLSGTPLLTTKLPGIPEEYFKYLFHIEDNKVELISKKMEEILKLSNEELADFGRDAQKFIIENKNSKNQIKKILSFFSELSSKK